MAPAETTYRQATIEDAAAIAEVINRVVQEPDTATLGVWVLPEYRRRGLGTAAAEYALGFARDKGYRRLRGHLPENNEVAPSFLSSIGALVPIYNPDMRFELPL